MGCGTGCLKILLIFFNILFWIFGLAVLAIGVWIKVDKEIANVGEVINLGLNNGDGELENIVEITAWIFIGSGIFAFIVGFFGCCGAIRESRVLLGFYIVCLVIVGCAEIGAGVYVAVRFDTIADDLSSFGSNWVRTQYDDKSVASLGFNYVQLEWCCCGFENYLDYKGSTYVKEDNRIKDGAWMSFACCKPSAKSTDSSDIQPADIDACETQAMVLAAGSNNGTSTDNIGTDHTGCDEAISFRATGCQEAVVTWAEERLPIFIGVGCGVAGVQLFIFIISVCMCVCIGREEKD